MSQEHEDIKECTYPWYFYLGFTFLMMFRMEKQFIHFSTKCLIFITKCLIVFLNDGIKWIQWWSRLILLLLSYYVGRFFFSPFYFNLPIIFDFEFMTFGCATERIPYLKTLDCRNCVFSEVINISGDS